MRVWICIAALSLAVSCQHSKPSSPPASHLHFSASLDKAKVNVMADGKSGSVDLQPQLAGVRVVSSQVIFSVRNEKGIYLVVDFVSRSSNGGGCVSGTEENLVWVAFDRSLRPVNLTSALIASCLQGVVVARIQQDDRSIVVTSDSAVQHLRGFVFFRKAAPELGFTFQKADLPQNEPDAERPN
jgi:hypothetical protein